MTLVSDAADAECGGSPQGQQTGDRPVPNAIVAPHRLIVLRVSVASLGSDVSFGHSPVIAPDEIKAKRGTQE